MLCDVVPNLAGLRTLEPPREAPLDEEDRPRGSVPPWIAEYGAERGKRAAEPRRDHSPCCVCVVERVEGGGRPPGRDEEVVAPPSSRRGLDPGARDEIDQCRPGSENDAPWRVATRFAPRRDSAPAVLLAGVTARADENLASAPGTHKQARVVHCSSRGGGLDDPRSSGNTALGAVRQRGSGRSLGLGLPVFTVRGCVTLFARCDPTPTPWRRHRLSTKRRCPLTGNIGSGRKRPPASALRSGIPVPQRGE